MRVTQPISRRRFLAAASVVAVCFGSPAHAQPEVALDGFRVIRARPHGPGDAPQSPTFVSTYDGTVPGPTLRIKRGEDLRVRVVNDLAEPTSVHWHGVRLPNAMDGVPGLTQAPIAPGTSFDDRFRPPDAGTFWYHAHVGAQVDRGLYAALIVEEAQPVDVDRDPLTSTDANRSRGSSTSTAARRAPRVDRRRSRFRPMRSGHASTSRIRLRPNSNSGV